MDGGNIPRLATNLGLIRLLPGKSFGERSIKGKLEPGEGVDWFRFRVGRSMASGNLFSEVTAEETRPVSPFEPPFRFVSYRIAFFTRRNNGSGPLKRVPFVTPRGSLPQTPFDPFDNAGKDSFNFRLLQPGTYYLKFRTRPTESARLSYSLSLRTYEKPLL